MSAKNINYEQTVGVETPREIQSLGNSSLVRPLTSIVSSLSAIANKKQEEKDKQQLLLQQYKYQGIISDKINQYYIDSTKIADPVEAEKQFNASVKGYTSGIVKNANGELAPYIQQSSNFYAGHASRKIAARQIEAAQAGQLESFYSSYEQHMNLMQGAAERAEADVSDSHMLALQRMIHDASQQGIVSPSQYVRMKEQTRTAYNEGGVIGEYKSKLFNKGIDEANRYRKSFINTPTSKFSPDEKSKILRRFDALNEQKAASDGYIRENFQSVANSLVYNATHGISSPDEEKKINDLRLINESKFDSEVLPKIKIGQQVNSVVSRYKYLPVKNIRSSAIELSNTSYGSYTKHQIGTQAGEILSAYARVAKEDPVQYYASDPTLRSKILESQTKNGELEPNVILDYLKTKNVPPEDMAVLPNASVQSIVQDLKQYPLTTNDPKQETRLDRLEGYVHQVSGPAREVFMKQLRGQGLPVADQFLVRLNSSDDQNVRSLTSQASVAFSTPKKDYVNLGVDYKQISDSLINNDTFSSYSDSLVGQEPGIMVKTLNQMKNHISQLAAQIHVKEGMDYDDAVDMATKALTSGMSYGSHHGFTFHYPSELDGIGKAHFFGQSNSGALNDSINFLTDMASKANLNISSGVLSDKNIIPGMVKDMMKNLVLEHSYFRNSQDGLGLVLVNQDGIPVTEENGRKFQVRFTDLKNPSSDMYQRISKWRLNKNKEIESTLKNKALNIDNLSGLLSDNLNNAILNREL